MSRLLRKTVFVSVVASAALAAAQPAIAAESYQQTKVIGSKGKAASQFNYPSGIDLTSSGSIYVADQFNQRVQKLAASGSPTLQWGELGDDDGLFKNPSDVAVLEIDGLDALVYVTDSANNRVQVFSSVDGKYLFQWTSVGSFAGALDGPYSVAVNDDQSIVYVVDRANHRIQLFTIFGAYLDSFGEQGSDKDEFNDPASVAVDSVGNIYVSDRGNDRVQKISPEGKFIKQLLGDGTEAGKLDNPTGIAIDSQDSVYVVDAGNDRVQKFTSTGEPVTKFAVSYDKDPLLGSDQVTDVAIDKSGAVYVTAPNSVFVYEPKIEIGSGGSSGEPASQPTSQPETAPADGATAPNPGSSPSRCALQRQKVKQLRARVLRLKKNVRRAKSRSKRRALKRKLRRAETGLKRAKKKLC